MSRVVARQQPLQFGKCLVKGVPHDIEIDVEIPVRDAIPHPACAGLLALSDFAADFARLGIVTAVTPGAPSSDAPARPSGPPRFADRAPGAA